ncbi:MAG: hypothetical protein KDD15_27995, partial [Lewinella sp.]|nr:hypothetical protein [Lewinella sp.]
MQPTAFTTLLCTLETKECADFSRFHRYMFPRRQRAQRYLDFLLLYHPDYHSRKDLTKAFVFQSLHPGSTYDNKSLGNVFSYLKGQLETFLSWQYLMQTGFERDVFLAKVLRERSLSKAYYQQLTAAGRNLEKADVVGQRTLINYLEIKHGDYYSSLDNKLQHRDYKGSVFGQLLKSQELLNDLLATKYAAELQNRKRILGQVDQKVG